MWKRPKPSTFTPSDSKCRDGVTVCTQALSKCTEYSGRSEEGAYKPVLPVMKHKLFNRNQPTWTTSLSSLFISLSLSPFPSLSLSLSQALYIFSLTLSPPQSSISLDLYERPLPERPSVFGQADQEAFTWIEKERKRESESLFFSIFA